MHKFMKALCQSLRGMGMKTVATDKSLVQGVDKKPAAVCWINQIIADNGLKGENAEQSIGVTVLVHSCYRGVRDVLDWVQKISDGLEKKGIAFESGDASFKRESVSISPEKDRGYLGTMKFNVWVRGES